MTDRPLDGDVAPGVEIAEKGADFERRVGEPAGVRNRPDPAAPDLAEDDLLIERKDLGPETSTFVAKGDPIPAALVDASRQPVRPAPRKK